MILVIADKNSTWKSREEDCGGKRAKIRSQELSEKDVEVKLLVGTIEYSENQLSRLWGKQAKSLVKNPGEMISKYPASLKLIEVLLIILLQTKTILGKVEKKIAEEIKQKLGR